MTDTIQDQIEGIVQHVVSNIGAADWSFSFDAIGTMLAGDHAGFFDSQSDPNGNKWEPLSSRAVDSRWLRQLGGGAIGSGRIGKTLESSFLAQGFSPDKSILIDTGALKISLAYRGSPNHVEKQGTLDFEFGTAVEYAAKHQFGAQTQTYDERRERWVEIELPPRPMVGWSDRSIPAAVEIIADDAAVMAVFGI